MENNFVCVSKEEYDALVSCKAMLNFLYGMAVGDGMVTERDVRLAVETLECAINFSRNYATEDTNENN